MRGINFTNWFTKSYGHINLEQSLMKKPDVLAKYLDMIEYNVMYHYVKRDPKTRGRCLIFVGTVVMAELVVERIKRKYPQLDTRKYTGEDSMKNVLEPDVCCSTLGSAGTAIDIDMLTTVIQTVSLLSTNANIQSFGRLREIDGRDDLKFIYLWSSDISSMEAHHNNRQKLFRGDYIDWKFDNHPVTLNPVIQRSW